MGKQRTHGEKSSYSLLSSREKGWSKIKGFIHLTDRKLKNFGIFI